MVKTIYKCTAATKEKLLKAIVKLVKEKGYQNITVRDICMESGVSNGAFYHHYGSKEALAKEAYLNIDQLLTRELIQYCNAQPALDGLYQVLETHLIYIKNEVGLTITEYYRILLDGQNISIFSPERTFYQAIHQQLSRCIDEGVVSSQYDLTFLTKYTIRFLRGYTFDWSIHNGSYDILDEFKNDFYLFINGIAK